MNRVRVLRFNETYGVFFYVQVKRKFCGIPFWKTFRWRSNDEGPNRWLKFFYDEQDAIDLAKDFRDNDVYECRVALEKKRRNSQRKGTTVVFIA